MADSISGKWYSHFIENENESIRLPSEIVEAWEPVYEENKEKEFTLRSTNKGEFKIIVKKEGLYYEPENKIFDPIKVKSYFKGIGGSHSECTISPVITALNVGCRFHIPKEDIMAPIEYWEKHFK